MLYIKTVPESIDFSELDNKFGARLRAFIYKRIWNKDDVEDIYQMTFVEAICSLSKFRGESRPETWLFGIALNLVRANNTKMVRRREYIVEPVALSEDGEARNYLEDIHCSACDPLEIVHYRQVLRQVSKKFYRLPKHMQLTLQLLVDESHQYDQIAKILNIPIGTVRSRLSRARDRLSPTTVL